jgi:hypothetical protein
MTFAKSQRSGVVHDFEPSRGIGTQIHFRGLCAGMTEPQGHLSNVTRRLQDHHRARMTKYVRKDPLSRERGAMPSRYLHMLV